MQPFLVTLVLSPCWSLISWPLSINYMAASLPFSVCSVSPLWRLSNVPLSYISSPCFPWHPPEMTPRGKMRTSSGNYPHLRLHIRGVFPSTPVLSSPLSCCRWLFLLLSNHSGFSRPVCRALFGNLTQWLVLLFPKSLTCPSRAF